MMVMTVTTTILLIKDFIWRSFYGCDGQFYVSNWRVFGDEINIITSDFKVSRLPSIMGIEANGLKAWLEQKDQPPQQEGILQQTAFRLHLQHSLLLVYQKTAFGFKLQLFLGL